MSSVLGRRALVGYHEAMTDLNTQEDADHLALDDPDYPPYFPPRDGGINLLGAFWRHSDLVDTMSVELKMARADLGNAPAGGFPVFGVASLVGRGVRFFVHDHPELDAQGKAVSDGSLVFIPRRMVEALNNLSFPPGDHGSRAHLLTWMSQVAMACGQHLLDMPGPVLNAPALTNGLLDTTEALPDALDPRNTVVFRGPSALRDALMRAFGKATGVLAVNELCGLFPDVSDEEALARSRARVGDAVAQARSLLVGAEADRFGTREALHEAAQAVNSDKWPAQSRALARGLVVHDQAVAAMEAAVARLAIGPYQPVPAEELNKHVFFFGADAAYSMHKHAGNMIQDPMAHWGELKTLIEGHTEQLPGDVLTHIGQCGRVSGKDGLNGPDFNREQIIRLFGKNPNLTQTSLDMLLNGGSGILWLGACSTENGALYLRDVVAASLQGKQIHQHARAVFKKTVSSQMAAAAWRAGGDALCLDKDGGQPLLKPLRAVAKNAALDVQDEGDVALEYGTWQCIKAFLPSLRRERLSQGLLRVARNRHALDLLPELLAIEGVRADATDRQGRTVAHHLLDHTDQALASRMVPVLVQLLERGLDPNAAVDGYRAGERANSDEPLAGWSVMQQAIVQWQHQRLARDTTPTRAAAPRQRL